MDRGRTREWLTGPALTVFALALTEIALDAFPPPTSVILILLSILPVAYAGLSGGFGPGFLSASLVTLYTIRYVSAGERALFAFSPAAIQGALIMVVITTGMASAMALLRRRERRLRRALEDRAAQLELRNAELVDSNSALEAFGYVISHDLKEPVRAIENYLDAANSAYGTPEGRADLAKAAEANARLVRLLSGLLSYSRASSMTPNVRPLSIEDIVRSDATRAQYEGLLCERHGELDVAPDIPPVLGDEVILAQLLGNVLLNAVRHGGKAPPRIRIASTSADAGEVHLIIDDNGPGFPQDVIARFRQLRGSRPATLRAGFGLVISHRAAQRLGGSMDLENLAQGARVHLRLRAANEAIRTRPGDGERLAKR